MAEAAGSSGAEGFELRVLGAAHAVCRLEPAASLPAWARPAPDAILSVTRTDRELSVVCAESIVPTEVRSSRGWRVLMLTADLEHSLTGVLVSLAAPLAEAGVPIFAISSFDTDSLLVPGAELGRALDALRAAGHRPAG